MNRLQKLLSPILERFGKLKPKLENLVNHTVFDAAVNISVGLLAAFLLGFVGRYLWFWVPPIAIALGAAAGVRFARGHLVAVGTFAVVSALYYCLSQPALVLLMAVVLGLAAGGFASWRLSGLKRRILGFIAAAALVPTAIVLLALAMYCWLLPTVHPLTIWLYNLSPVLSMIPTLGILAIVELRQPKNARSHYWLATPALATLFCLCFWPAQTYVGMIVFVLTAVALSVFAYRERPTEKHSGRSHRAFVVTSGVAVVFCLSFWLSNGWSGMYYYQMANAMRVNEITLDQLAPTVNNRLVPKLAAFDYAAGNNGDTITTLSQTARPIVSVDNDGVERFYWELIRYPDLAALQTRPGLFLTHLRAITGGCEGAVLVDAGERGRFGKPIDTNFLFCDQSAFTRGAFYVRHPGATLMPGMIALTKDGRPYVVLPFVNKVLQWGAMVPELSGVMTISPWGFVQDMLPGEAAAAFPGVSFVPSDLARQYAELWAQDSSLWSKYISGDQFEVSEIPTDGDNAYPYWQDFRNIGLKGVINFEPMGKQANQWVRVGLFDRSSLSMTVVRWDPTLNLTGPKQLIKYVSTQSHIGLYNVTGREPVVVVSPDHCLYVLASLLQHNAAEVAYHGYAKNTIMDPHGQDYVDVGTRQQVDQAISGSTCQLKPVAQ